MMPPTSSPRAPLARSTLIHMGVRIAVLIALTTIFSYLHMHHTLRTETLGRLEQYVTEWSQRQQDVFILAENNHVILKKALEERIQAMSREDERARFDHLFVRMPDGTVRSRPEGFDGTKQVGVFIPQGVPLDDGLRRKILASYDVLTQYGPAFRARFTNTYITLSEGPLIVYWPERPNWCLEAEPTYPSTTLDYYTISQPEKNPRRKTVWSPAFVDIVSRLSMVTVSTPLDVGSRHVATVHHDVLLKELMARPISQHLSETYKVIFRDDGQIIARPEHLGSEEQQEHLRRIIERGRARQPGQIVLELPEHDEYFAMVRLEGPGWYLATVLPESVVAAAAFRSARYVLLLGVLSLLLELAIMSWVLKRHITRPLLAFTQATGRVAAGDFHVELDTTRGDELGQLARSFQLMADEVQRREEALRQANESLELRVEERTRELKDVHMSLVQTARRAGMAEIATNVLHNVGNVLNSVYTSAQLAKERMLDLRLEHVGRVATMLKERQSDISAFLTQDERGRHALPFLNRLGENLVDERKEIISLLDDVGRYIEHIGDIVKVQQNYARTPRVHESVVLAELLEDALRINSTGLTRHQVKVQRHFSPVPPVLTDKHKTLMILVNLVSNAKYALDAVPQDERLLTLKLGRTGEDRIHIEIHDNGMGIAPEMLTRIFQYGFTTREDGHGFGLHSSALAAQELGGSLIVHSDGPGHGATFTLELPYTPVQEMRLG